MNSSLNFKLNMATSQSQSQPFFWTEITIEVLIPVWAEADIQRIMDAKTKKNSLAYMKMVKGLNAQGIACSKAQWSARSST